MPFSRTKFTGLERSHRAKKLADLAARLLGGADPAAETRTALIAEYNQLVDWNGSGPRLEENADERSLREVYVHWRRAAGLGLEGALFASAATGDRDTPLAPALPYEVWLHDIRSGHNVGSILRTAECFGFSRVHRSGYTPGPEQAAVRAAAMGCERYVPIQSHDSVNEFMRWLDQEKTGGRSDPPRLVALETSATATDIDDFAWPAAAVLVIGNEELGVAPEILERCDSVVRIPQRGRKVSLNLANAFAIAAYAASRASTGP